MDDVISRQAAIDTFEDTTYTKNEIRRRITELPSEQLENCEGCKHFGKWENEVEYGYPSLCTRCKRRVEDHYER